MNILSFSRSAIIFTIIIFTTTNLVLAYGATVFNHTQNSTDFIKASCIVTLYPRLCFNSLQVFASKINNSSLRLAHTALGVSLFHVNRTLTTILRMPLATISAREAGAIRDCIDNVEDSLYEMKKSMREFRRLGRSNLRFQISNIQTWVSAALTDEETCIDGFKTISGRLKFAVRRMMRKLERLTSNSLALFNSFAASITHGRVH